MHELKIVNDKYIKEECQELILKTDVKFLITIAKENN